MSAAPVVLVPQLFPEAHPDGCRNVQQRKGPHRLRLVQACAVHSIDQVAEVAEALLTARMPEVGERGRYAFYRKYTEGMLRRAMKMSLDAGRVPSFIGRELFRGDVTNCKVSNFDDSVIFVADIDRCIARLQKSAQYLVHRIGMQEYTQAETAAMTGIPLRNVIRYYNRALDDLTRMFLERNMLQKEISDAMKGVENNQ
jgi:hypothetical protein